MNSLYAFGPGLTTQLGPFKTNRGDYPRARKNPWKGGGVSGGGQLHAGNGNWYTAMTPQVIKATPYILAPSEYASIIVPPTQIVKPSAGRRTKRQFIKSGLGNPEEPSSRPGAPPNTSGATHTPEEGANAGTLNANNEPEDVFFDANEGPEEEFFMPGEFPQGVRPPNIQRIVEPLHRDRNESSDVGTQADISDQGVWERELGEFYTTVLEENSRLHEENRENQITQSAMYNAHSQLVMRSILRSFSFPVDDNEDINMGQFMETMRFLGVSQGDLVNSRNAMLDFINTYRLRELGPSASTQTEQVTEEASEIEEYQEKINHLNLMLTSNKSLNDMERVQFLATIERLADHISDLESESITQPVRTNAPATSSNLAQQAADIAGRDSPMSIVSSNGSDRRRTPSPARQVAGKKRKNGIIPGRSKGPRIDRQPHNYNFTKLKTTNLPKMSARERHESRAKPSEMQEDYPFPTRFSGRTRTRA